MADRISKTCTVTADELADVAHGQITAYIWGALAASGFPIESVGVDRWRVAHGDMWCENTAEGRMYTWVGIPTLTALAGSPC